MSSSNKVEVFHPIEIKYSCVCKTAEERNLFVDFIAAMKKLKEKNESGFQPSTPVQDGFTLDDIEKAFDAGGEYEYRKHFGSVPTSAPDKQQYIKSLPSPPVNKQD